jgi:hypothetical protein
MPLRRRPTVRITEDVGEITVERDLTRLLEGRGDEPPETCIGDRCGTHRDIGLRSGARLPRVSADLLVGGEEERGALFVSALPGRRLAG